MAGHGILFYGVVVPDDNEEFIQLLRSYKGNWKQAIASRFASELTPTKLVKELGCIIGQEVANDVDSYFIAIDKAVYQGNSHRAAKIPSFDVEANWDKKLARVTEALNLPPQTPAWFLTFFMEDW